MATYIDALEGKHNDGVEVSLSTKPKRKRVGISLRTLGTHFGKDVNYFYVVQSKHPEKFQFIMGLDNDPIKAVQAYKKLVSETLKKIEEYTFKQRKKFIEVLPKAGYSNTPQNVYALERVLFSIKDDELRVSFTRLQRYLKIIEEMEK